MPIPASRLAPPVGPPDFMNILILNPPRRDGIVMNKEGRCMQRIGSWGYVMSPVTMVTIATMLRDDGHNPTVIDAGVDINDFQRLLARVRELEPAVVLMNAATPTIADDLYASRFLKENVRGDVVTVLYGIHVSILYEEALRSDNRVDYCVIGEPELTVRELVAALAAGTSPKHVLGIAYRPNAAVFSDGGSPPGDGILFTGRREHIRNLDDLPIPDWSFVDTGNYRLPFSNEKFLLLHTNRGCPYRCTFCNAHVYYGRTPRRRSVGHLMRELQSDIERFGVRNFMFWAEEFILDKEFVTEFCNAILDSGLQFSWVCNSRVDAVDVEVLSLIRRAGCWNIAFGIESGVPEILARTNKQTTIGQVVNAVSLARGCGLTVTGHVIIGLPGDTPETMTATERFIDGLGLDFVQYYCAVPYPGSDLYTAATNNNWLKSSDWARWEHNFSVIDYPHLKAVAVMKTRRRFLRRFYFKPGTIFRTARGVLKKPGNLLTFARNARDFLRWM